MRRLADLEIATIVCYHGGVVGEDANGQLRRVIQEASGERAVRGILVFVAEVAHLLVRKLADGKYASCLRAHGPQKATPKISTSALRGQGLSV